MADGQDGATRRADAIESDRDPIRSAAAALGSRGGRKRAETMTPERRAEIARAAAAKRWSKPE